MKKVLSLLLVSILICTSFAACATKKTGNLEEPYLLMDATKYIGGLVNIEDDFLSFIRYEIYSNGEFFYTENYNISGDETKTTVLDDDTYNMVTSTLSTLKLLPDVESSDSEGGGNYNISYYDKEQKIIGEYYGTVDIYPNLNKMFTELNEISKSGKIIKEKDTEKLELSKILFSAKTISYDLSENQIDILSTTERNWIVYRDGHAECEVKINTPTETTSEKYNNIKISDTELDALRMAIIDIKYMETHLVDSPDYGTLINIVFIDIDHKEGITETSFSGTTTFSEEYQNFDKLLNDILNKQT